MRYYWRCRSRAPEQWRGVLQIANACTGVGAPRWADQFELTAFEAPTKIRWTERSKNMITVPDGGYDLEKGTDTETKVTIHNTFEGHGFGKLLVGFALRGAVKDAPAFAERIKSAVEGAKNRTVSDHPAAGAPPAGW